LELWLLYAVGAAVFAALVTIFAKIGIRDVDSHLATALRTVVVLVFAWVMVAVAGTFGEIGYITGRTWVFLVLSGLATGASWICFFRALKLGDVNKVVPIDKSSTILTMVLAFVFLSEPLGWLTIVGMVMMGVGTWLMLELAKRGPGTVPKSVGQSPIIYAALGAVFAALVAIFGKIGVADMDATLWTAIRTMVVLPLAWIVVLKAGSGKQVKVITPKSWIFLTLSGVATGASWLLFYHALKIGNASAVVPIDKLSILLTMLFAGIFLKEKFSKKSLIGLALLTIGTLLPIVI